MKKVICLLLMLGTLTSLCGCFAIPSTIGSNITFYYCRNEYQYHEQENVIVAEHRDYSGRMDDLHFLLTLYLMGPVDESLASPLPQYARITEVHSVDRDIALTITDLDQALSDSRFSVACACLALTCFELADCDTVTVSSGGRTITLSRESLLLTDNITVPETKMEESK